MIRVILLHSGKWLKDAANKQWNYETEADARGLMIPRECTYDELLSKLSKILNLNPTDATVVLKFGVPNASGSPPILIENDEDVQFFIAEVENTEMRIPLCVDIKYQTCSFEGSFNPIQQTPIFEDRSMGHDEPNVTPVFPETVRASEQRDHIENIADVAPTPMVHIGVNMEETCMVGECGEASESSAIEIDQLFPSKKELQRKISVCAMRENFEYRVKKSNKELLVLVCVDATCEWRVRASRVCDTELWRVCRYISTHTCSSAVRQHDHPQASSWVIGECIKSKYEGVGRVYRPNDIIQDVRREYGVNISYGRAWRARECALEAARGSPEASYALLPSYAAMLEKKVPGSVTHIETDEGNNFKYFFMAIGPCIRGFLNCIRPVIAVDGAFLKGKYLGTMFIATSKDGNNQVYPLALGVGDSENDESWGWFFGKLRAALGDIDGLVFISDRNRSIEKAIKEVFPDSFHGACIYHLGQNLKAKFKRSKVHPLFFTAAKAYRISEFERLMTLIHRSDPEVGNYLMEAGYNRWSRAYSDGRRYNIMTTNIAECLNAVFKDARELPIHQIAEYMRNMLQKWFHERRSAAAGMSTYLTTWAESEMGKKIRMSTTYQVSPVDIHEYHVADGDLNATVNVSARTCSCRQFDLDQMPCSHALAVARFRRIDPYMLCSPYYTSEALVSAYAEPISPLGHTSEWDVSQEVATRVVLPPTTRRQTGRRRKERIPSAGEQMSSKRCGRCGRTGHNRQTCKNPIPLHPNDV